MKKTIRVKKWGNSLALRIPSQIADELNLQDSSVVMFSSDKFGFYARPLQRQRPSLEELVDKITPENTHPETDWGQAEGKEVW
jgi:antitoxin MazE